MPRYSVNVVFATLTRPIRVQKLLLFAKGKMRFMLIRVWSICKFENRRKGTYHLWLIDLKIPFKKPDEVEWRQRFTSIRRIKYSQCKQCDRLIKPISATGSFRYNQTLLFVIVSLTLSKITLYL